MQYSSATPSSTARYRWAAVCDQFSPAQLPRRCGWLGVHAAAQVRHEDGIAPARARSAAASAVELPRQSVCAAPQSSQFADKPLQVHAAAVDVGVGMPQSRAWPTGPSPARHGRRRPGTARSWRRTPKRCRPRRRKRLRESRRRPGTRPPCRRSPATTGVPALSPQRRADVGRDLADDRVGIDDPRQLGQSERRTSGTAAASHWPRTIVGKAAEMQVALVDKGLRRVQAAQRMAA